MFLMKSQWLGHGGAIREPQDTCTNEERRDFVRGLHLMPRGTYLQPRNRTISGMCLARPKSSSQDLKTDRIFMYEFLFLALVIIYLAICYVPVSETPKDNWQSHRNEQSSHGNSEMDAAGRQ
jgi:hypothetical protein